jgi:tRNA/rRNA methyltransferase
MPLLRANLNLVCHQLRTPDNLGAIARLMANFGFHRLTLSEPVTQFLHEANRLAVGAEHLLKTLTVVPNLRQALADAVYVVGSTSRSPLRGRIAITPEEAAQRLAQEARRGPVALLFGGEQRGLSDDDLAEVQDILAIDTDEVQPSMNLSQSAAVLLYLCRRADEMAPPDPVPPPGARLATLHALEQRMGGWLKESGFLNPQAPEYALNELMHTLSRARLSQREAEMWLSAFAHLKRLNLRNEG